LFTKIEKPEKCHFPPILAFWYIITPYSWKPLLCSYQSFISGGLLHTIAFMKYVRQNVSNITINHIKTAQSFRLKVVLSFDLIYKLLSIWISFDTLYYILRKGTQPKIHDYYILSLNTCIWTKITFLKHFFLYNGHKKKMLGHSFHSQIPVFVYENWKTRKMPFSSYFSILVSQPKIHETYNFSLNLFGILPYTFHEGYGM
jgi:hypothetical protein